MMKAIVRSMLATLPDEHADQLLIAHACEAMKNKLAASRAKGKGGWHTPSASTAQLQEALQAHVSKGDPVDVMNYAAMILLRKEIYDESDVAITSGSPTASATVDIRSPMMIRLNADGHHLPDKADADPYHAATLLPQFGLIIDASRPELADNWAAACEQASNIIICGSKADGLLEASEFNLIIDRSQSPSYSQKSFPNLRTDYIYWTATPHPSDSSYACYVYLNGGNVNWYNRYYKGLALACRRVSPRQ